MTRIAVYEGINLNYKLFSSRISGGLYRYGYAGMPGFWFMLRGTLESD